MSEKIKLLYIIVAIFILASLGISYLNMPPEERNADPLSGGLPRQMNIVGTQ